VRRGRTLNLFGQFNPEHSYRYSTVQGHATYTAGTLLSSRMLYAFDARAKGSREIATLPTMSFETSQISAITRAISGVNTAIPARRPLSLLLRLKFPFFFLYYFWARALDCYRRTGKARFS
jgi:hypothetical protein